MKHKKILLTFPIIILLFAGSFIFGTHWPATLYTIRQIPHDKFICFSHNNFWESFQTNCFVPKRKDAFAFKKEMKCQTLTNHQFDEGLYSYKDGNRTTITQSKVDYNSFTLFFEENKIVRSKDDGSMDRFEDYTIMRDANGIVQASRPVKEENLNNVYSYEFITFSKNTGRGMEVWHNISKFPFPDDSIASHFFQCE